MTESGISHKRFLKSVSRHTKLCKFHAEGHCLKGKSCGFAHSLRELQHTPDLRGSKICVAPINGEICQSPAFNFARCRDESRRLCGIPSTHQEFMDNQCLPRVAVTNAFRLTSLKQKYIGLEEETKRRQKATQHTMIQNCGPNSFTGDMIAQKPLAQFTADDLRDCKADRRFDEQACNATCPLESSNSDDFSKQDTEVARSDAYVNVDPRNQLSGYKVRIRNTFLHFDEGKTFVPLRRIGSAPP